jgi:hypothetical protein
MELLGRVCAALGISLVLTLLLLVLYQDDSQQQQGSAITQVSTAADPITISPASAAVSVR